MSCKWSKGTSGPAGDEHHNLVAVLGDAPANGALAFKERGGCLGGGKGFLGQEERTFTLQPKDTQRVLSGVHVRRLTPRECERLQGFPDGYTDVPYRGKPAADGPRYRALGNSMAVPVMRWIGERISHQMKNSLHSSRPLRASTGERW